ncbi:MAG: hypothetical protein AAF726_18105 [Planctomycetota bacterium]
MICTHARWILAAIALAAAGCSGDRGDPVVWKRAAWRNAAAPIAGADATYVAAIAGDPAARSWTLSVYEALTGRAIAERSIGRPGVGQFAEVHALGSDGVAFWFTGGRSAPTYWRWQEGAERISETSIDREDVRGARWGWVAAPGVVEPVLCVLRAGSLQLRLEGSVIAGEVSLPSLADASGDGALDVEVLSYDADQVEHWELRLSFYAGQSKRAAHIALERDRSGWSTSEVIVEPPRETFASDLQRYVPVGGDVRESTRRVPYSIRSGQLRDRTMEGFRIAGPVSDWPVFGGRCVPIYRSGDVVRREWLVGDTRYLESELEIIALDSLEPALRVSAVVEYPDICVPSIGFVGSGSDEILYWICVDGQLIARRRDLSGSRPR